MGKKIYVNKEIDVADLDGDKVMMNMDLGRYFGLNSVGSYIWELIQTPMSVDEIVYELLKKYEVKEDVCKAKVESFIKKLETFNLVTLR